MKNLLNSKAKSIYIHIPFCKRKCNYCSFTSFTNLSQYENSYVVALCKEIENFNSKGTIETIYLGGGTPNLLSLENIEKILTKIEENFHIAHMPEITIEINPAISNGRYFKELKKLGINRLSLGVQSFNEKILKILNRLHTTKEVFETIKKIENAEIKNYSIDLIYGIFYQTLEDIENDLKIIKRINPKHISTYGLKIEKNTPFEKYDQSKLPSEDLCYEMYMKISNELEKEGFVHYEISNFAKPEFEAKHNLTYWQNEEYIGLGVAAHGYLNNIRYKNLSNLEKYIENPLNKEIININTLSDTMEEEIFLGLRLRKGINLKIIKEKYGRDLLKSKGESINKFVENNYARLENETFHLTTKGFVISNYIISEILA